MQIANYESLVIRVDSADVYDRDSRRYTQNRVECREMPRESVLFPAIASRRCVTQSPVKRRTTPRGVPV